MVHTNLAVIDCKVLNQFYLTFGGGGWVIKKTNSFIKLFGGGGGSLKKKMSEASFEIREPAI